MCSILDMLSLTCLEDVQFGIFHRYLEIQDVSSEARAGQADLRIMSTEMIIESMEVEKITK